MAQGNSQYRRTIVLYLLAIVAPALVLLYFGVASFQRQRQAMESLQQSNLRLSGEKLAADLERRTAQLAEQCLRGDIEISRRKDPMARYFFQIDRGRVVYPPLHTPLPWGVDDLLQREPVKVRDSFAEAFREAESQELRQSNFEKALAGYRQAAALPVSNDLRALALHRTARCLEKSSRTAEARQSYQLLADRYGDLTDLSHRPYALIAALALDSTAAQKLELWRQAVRGRWQLSAEQLDYYAPLLGGAGDGSYAEQFRFARGLEEQFRHQGVLRPDEVYPFAFSADGAKYQTFYRLSPGGDPSKIVGFTMDSNWLRDQLLPAGARLLAKGSNRGGGLQGSVRAGFSSLFPFWELELPAPAAAEASGGLALQAATTALVLCLLLMGVVLLIRDFSRDSRLNQVRADFVGAVSHELKTPISVIRLYGETLLDDDDFSAAQRREMYEIITRESDRLTQLIDKVLTFSKIDRGEKQYQLQAADLAPVIERTVETYRRYLQRRGYAVETQLAAELPAVRFDADAVSQALVNLLDNAAKYSGDNKSIAVRSYASNGCAVLEVEDHGIGIPRDEQERIFERFYRVGNAVAKGGYGLGLYLVRHIMEAHSGKVELESEPLRGSRFRLIFPVAKSAVVESGSHA